MSDIVSLAVGIAAHRRINSIKSDMRAQKLNFDESELSAVSMRQDIEKLYMLVEALWLIVKETSGMNDEDLVNALMTLKGVGIKVASCTALFGFHRLDLFPIDVWIQRALDAYYNGVFPLEKYR